jgi:hypothetical protein
MRTRAADPVPVQPHGRLDRTGQPDIHELMRDPFGDRAGVLKISNLGKLIFLRIISNFTYYASK